MSNKAIVIEIKNRFFYAYKNNRVNTAWSLAGAKLFSDFGSENLQTIENVLKERKIKYKKKYVQIVCSDEIEQTEIIENTPKIESVTILNENEVQEQLLLRFKLPNITDLSFLDEFVSHCYNKTGNKFSVSFHGSKGYLSNISISCEGFQEQENRIFVENLRNRDYSLKNVMVNIFHSDLKGIRISQNNDNPKIFKVEDEKLVSVEEAFADTDDYPF